MGPHNRFQGIWCDQVHLHAKDLLKVEFEVHELDEAHRGLELNKDVYVARAILLATGVGTKNGKAADAVFSLKIRESFRKILSISALVLKLFLALFLPFFFLDAIRCSPMSLFYYVLADI